MEVLFSPLILAFEPERKFQGVYSPPPGETNVQLRESYAFAQATKMALPPTVLFSFVGFLVMVSQVGAAGVGCGAGAGLGVGTGLSSPPRAAGFGTGKVSVGSLVPIKTS